MASVSSRPIRIAFDNICTQQWIAGCHYLKNLFIALKSIEEVPNLVVCGEAADDSAKILDQYVEQHLVLPIQHSKLLNRAFRLERRFGVPLGMSQLAASFLRKHLVDVLFASIDQGQRFNVPLMAWIPDFQHLHLPGMFSPQEIVYRDRTYLRTARRADRIILSSNKALADFKKSAPVYAHKGRVVNFVAHVPASVYDSDPIWVCERYHLPERFIYAPNQFWKHKNHLLIVEALYRLKTNKIDATIVCSGNTADSRNPDYFPQLQSAIKRLGLQDRFIILGTIPHEHIFQLIRQSMAVLQPSLFEGWSTSVEETKSIGKRIVLSDLAVHREQNPPSALFFDPVDPQALANCLARTLEEATPGPDRLLENKANKELPYRTKAFGEAFMKIVREVVSSGTSGLMPGTSQERSN